MNNNKIARFESLQQAAYTMQNAFKECANLGEAVNMVTDKHPDINYETAQAMWLSICLFVENTEVECEVCNESV